MRVFVSLCLLLAGALSPLHAATYDVLIRGGTVYADGYSDGLRADVGISGDRIAAVGDLSADSGRRTLKADGLLVVPGFIDVHGHGDTGGGFVAYLQQGVTTMVQGNCGGCKGVQGMAAHLAEVEAVKLGPNYMTLVGHNSLRRAVGLSDATPTAVQMDEMKRLLAAGMEAGACGLSSGLEYSPGFNAKTDEVVELCRVVAEHGGVYATHMRDEGGHVLDSVDEAIEIGRRSGARVEISHAKCAGPKAWGQSGEFLARMDRANAEGVTVRLDAYPYTASTTTIEILFPLWARNDWKAARGERRDELLAFFELHFGMYGSADYVFLTRGEFPNTRLSDVARRLGKSPGEVLVDDIGLRGSRAIYHVMKEDDVRKFLASRWTMIGSDGPTSSHPRGAGTFPRVWGEYGRVQGMLDAKECVRRTSTLAAEQFGLLTEQRGAVREGLFADITILDWDRVEDTATYQEPNGVPKGIPYVIINGRFAVDRGTPNGRPGRVLRFPSSDQTSGG